MVLHMSYDYLISAGVGVVLSIVIILLNTRNSKAYVELYLEPTSNEAEKDKEPKPLSKRNPSVDSLEPIYGVKESDVIHDQTPILNADNITDAQYDIGNDTASSEPIDSIYLIEWVIFVLFILAICYLINETTGGDFARIIVGMFPREFEALGLKDYFQRLPVASNNVARDL